MCHKEFEILSETLYFELIFFISQINRFLNIETYNIILLFLLMHRFELSRYINFLQHIIYSLSILVIIRIHYKATCNRVNLRYAS